MTELKKLIDRTWSVEDRMVVINSLHRMASNPDVAASRLLFELAYGKESLMVDEARLLIAGILESLDELLRDMGTRGETDQVTMTRLETVTTRLRLVLAKLEAGASPKGE